MSLVVLTRSPKFNIDDVKARFKSAVKVLFHQKRGPDTLIQNLLFGLKALPYDYKYNPSEKGIHAGDVVYVNRSLAALEWAIEAKRSGKIAKLIAGPVLVVLPTDNHEIICDKNIDRIIVPAEWVKNLWLSIKPELATRISVWAGGVDEYDAPEKKGDKVLLYEKKCSGEMVKKLEDFLSKNNFQFEKIAYGRYQYSDFLKKLEEAKLMIFLSESESQGLALCEAWMKGVPTLVWNRGFWEYKGNIWKDQNVSAPYLSNQSGMFFKDVRDFESKFPEFVRNLAMFSPREYAKNNFSIKVTTEKFLKLI